MKTPEEIKTGLERCSRIGDYCFPCAFEHTAFCRHKLAEDALAYIQQLELNDSQVKKALSDNGFASLEAFLQSYNQVKAERDAAVMDLKVCTGCIVCKNYAVAGLDDCAGCGCENEMFEWRGVCAENSGEEDEPCT